jgi:Zn-dependent M28 family amino/carboxypeptidase
MLVTHSKNRRPRPTAAAVAGVLADVSADALRHYVEMLAFPRHYEVERAANVRARDTLLKLLGGFGYTSLQLWGRYDNIVATSGSADGPRLLLGAHYDSVPGTPGADDNGSAVAVCLEAARLIQKHGIGSTAVVFFNREEDGLLGSTEFVEHLARQSALAVGEAHVFEMVGYCTREPDSQRTPPGIPGFVAPSVGDFLGLLANSGSNAVATELATLAASYVPAFPVVALKMYLGVEKLLGHLHRSDHAPFWKAGIPAVMWTDTAEFRNPNYHLATDTPDTLDYEFMTRVARLALARAATRTG